MKLNPRYWLIIILILSAFLRFYHFNQEDVYTDEVLIAIRSIGMIDFSASGTQTSPWQWEEKIPSWMHLSMHDHPILVFLIQHIFFKIFGLNTIGLRLASILAGIFSVFLIYLIGKKLFNEKIGLISAFILSITPYHLWVSRTGLQESIVILFMLLAFYYFLKSLENKKYILFTSGLSGLCLMCKLTPLILFPIFLLIIIYKKQLKSFLTSKYFWLGILIFVTIISPLIIYNIKMVQSYGHLDYQLSAAFGQNVAQWQTRYGRQLVGDLKARISNLPIRLKEGLSWPAFIFFIATYLALIWHWLKTKRPPLFILVITILAWFFWYFAIGPTRRFMSYIMPFVSLSIAWGVYNLYKKIPRVQNKKVLIGLLLLLMSFELFFTFNTFYFFRPKGPKGILWSHANIEFKSWGFHNLDQYLNKLLKNKMPYASFPTKHVFLSQIKDEALKKMKNKNYESYPILLVYDANIFDLAALWLFHRRVIYNAWPILDVKTYIDTVQSEGADVFQKIGIKETYLISPTPNTYLEYKKPLTDWGFKLETILIEQNIKPEIINDDSGRAVFKIYKFF